MNRRKLLVGLATGLATGLAGCAGEEPNTGTAGTEGTTETPNLASDTPSSTSQPEADTETSGPKGPVVLDSSIAPEQDYRGDAIPKGSTLAVDVEFDAWAHEGTAEGTINIQFDPEPQPRTNIVAPFEEDGSQLVVQEYSTTIGTNGWATGEYLVEITVTDSVSEQTSLSNEHTIQIAGYTRTNYRVSAEAVEKTQPLVDEAMDAFAPQNTTILDITPESSFDPQPVNQPLNEADQLARDALDDDKADPFVDQLERVRNLASVFGQLADAQYEITQSQNTLVEIDHTIEAPLESFEEELEVNTDSLDELESRIESDRDYPLPVEEKLSALRTDVSNLSDFTAIVEDLQYATELLDDGQSAEEIGDNRRAESLAIDATREFETILRDLEDKSVLPDTTEEFTNRAEGGLEDARNLRDDVAPRKE